MPFYGGETSYENGLPSGWHEAEDTGGIFQEMFRLARVVHDGSACDLPGVGIKYNTFVPAMWAAVRAGFVQPQHAEFVQQGLRWGFEIGLHPSRLHGHRFFNNYGSATGEFRGRVTEATEARVEAGRTLALGQWADGVKWALKKVFEAAYIFPMGATAKPLEPHKARPTDDHTRTGLNAACDMSGPPSLHHSLDAYAEMAEMLKPGYCAHVTDVEAAFPMLPIAPWLWPFFMHRFYPSSGDTNALNLYTHINGDFGTRGFPGVFKIFFVDVVLNMARAASVLSIPLTVYVDDLAAVASTSRVSSRVMMKFQEWAVAVCGVVFKVIKDRHGSQVQLFLGFWWDSLTGTRTLEEHKLLHYMDMLLDFSTRRSLTLRERQQVAGRMQRAILTLPPGASCLLSNIFLLMVGLSVAWQKRRTTSAERRDYRFLYDILSMNSGRGYYTFERFSEGPTINSDASRSRRYSGGGWVSSWGPFDWWIYGTAARKKPIDFLEGDTVIHCVETQGQTWARRWIPFGVDNQSFMKSAVKGRSRAERLNLLLKRLFVLQVRFDCLLRFFWLSSEDNELADDLSREDGLARFLSVIHERGFLDASATLAAAPNAGRTRTLDLSAPISEDDLAAIGRWRRPHVDMVAFYRQVPAAVRIQAVARGFLSRKVERQCTAPSHHHRWDWSPNVACRLCGEVPHHFVCRTCRAEFCMVCLDDALLPPYGPAKPGPVRPEPEERPTPRQNDHLSSHAQRLGAAPRRRSSLMVLLALTGGCFAAPHEGYSAQVASVPYPRATLYAGLPAEYLSTVDDLVGNRLAPSSMEKVATAFARYWVPLADANGWDHIIATDDPERGGKMCAFVCSLVDHTELVADSIGTYVWALRWKMKLHHQADPVLGVMHWHEFMTGMRVKAHVPHEPRRAVPIALLLAIADAVRPDCFWEVQFMFFIVVLLFTFSRSECPCPKHFTGRDSWDDNKHWMVRDIVIRSIQGVYVLAVRFKAIKQDRRIERPEARGDDRTNVLPGESTKGGSDWSFVGDAPGPLSAFAWYRRLMAFYPGPRSATSPFFMAKDRIRFYTYTAAMADFQVMLKRVSTDHAYALHGIRVTGWNCGATVSPSLAEAHGGWKPGSAARYSRFQLSQVFALPAQMMAAVPATPVQTPPPVMAAHGADEGEVLPPLDDFLAGEVPGFQPGVEAGVLPPLADFLAGEVPGFQPGAEAAASGANTTLQGADAQAAVRQAVGRVLRRRVQLEPRG